MPNYATEDEAAILAYLAANNINNYQRDEDTGIFYYFQIFTSSLKPRPTSEVEVKYRASNLDGDVLYSHDTTALRINLPKAMVGWRLGLLKFAVGSRGTLIVPSRFAYGNKGLDGIVPPNTVLLFDIELIDIHPFF
jgi:FKBP-type peptidyl-prolyl cis-trans isomerase